MDELNTLANYETNLNDYIRTNLINWLLKGGVTDAQWQEFQNGLNGGDFGTLVLCGLGGIFVEALNDVSSHLAPFST